MPTLPPVDERQTTSSSSGSSNQTQRPTLPVSTDLEIGEHPQVELQRPGASEEHPIQNETGEGVLFIIKDGLLHKVEPLPAPLDSLFDP